MDYSSSYVLGVSSAVRITAPFAAWATLTALDAADRVSVGGRVTVKVYETV